jgi:ubiquitin-conjugating enzyme E2 M
MEFLYRKRESAAEFFCRHRKRNCEAFGFGLVWLVRFPEFVWPPIGQMPPRRAANPTRAACLLRLDKDLNEVVKEMPLVKLEFPDPKNQQHFIIPITPTSGLWRGGTFRFDIQIPDEWPIVRPNVTILTRVWHPNLQDLPEGNAVCLSILRKAYQPTITVSQIIVGLQFLFAEPNAIDPLNREAAKEMRANERAFKNKVESYVAEFAQGD